MDIAPYKKIVDWKEELDGVFTLPDLKVLLREKSEATLYRTIAGLVETGALIKVIRGIYATPEAELPTISSRIEPKSYISTGTVLAKKALIGSIPGRRVQAVKTGRPRTYRCELGTIEHLSLSPKMFFGYEARDGMLWATPEKAFLDVCYFTYRGKQFSFDPGTDVDIERLDFDVIDKYLEVYDPRFSDFFKQNWWPA
jgi:hypothetical protein